MKRIEGTHRGYLILEITWKRAVSTSGAVRWETVLMLGSLPQLYLALAMAFFAHFWLTLERLPFKL